MPASTAFITSPPSRDRRRRTSTSTSACSACGWSRRASTRTTLARITCSMRMRKDAPARTSRFFPGRSSRARAWATVLTHEVALEVPAGSIDYWGTRLQRYGARIEARETRFGDDTIALVDPHGLAVARWSRAAGARPFTPWDASPVPAEHQVRALFGARSGSATRSITASFLTSVLGFEQLATRTGGRASASATRWCRRREGDAGRQSRGMGCRRRAPSRVARR